MQRPPKSLFSVSISLPLKLQNTVMGEETVQVSSLSHHHHPLFSCSITLSSLILIYFPNDLLRWIFLSPVLLISGALLFSLLHLGSTRESTNTRPEESYENLEEEEAEVFSVRFASDLMGDFVEWNLRAPLEVIHEENDYEDEEEEEEEKPGEKDPTRFREMERYPSLSLCYPESDPESDSASSSEFNFPEIGDWNSPGFRWEEEDGGIGGEGLIEIKLDGSHNNNNYKTMFSKWNQTELDFHGEEDGLIEIDLFP